MPNPAVRCPACGHALFTVDEPAWPVRAAPGPAAPEGPLLLTVTRAAELLGVSRSTLYQLVAAGRVPVVRLGRAVRVPRRELERLAEPRRCRLPWPSATTMMVAPAHGPIRSMAKSRYCDGEPPAVGCSLGTASV
jgi:excisionase family DNA binding protein